MASYTLTGNVSVSVTFGPATSSSGVDYIAVVAGSATNQPFLGGNGPTQRQGDESGAPSSDEGAVMGGGDLLKSASCRMQFGLGRLQAVKFRAEEMDAALAAIFDLPNVSPVSVIAEIQASCELVPKPPSVRLFTESDLRAALGQSVFAKLLCKDMKQFRDLDPVVQLSSITRDGRSGIKCLAGDYLSDLVSKSSWEVVSPAKGFLDELKNVNLNKGEAELLECLANGVLDVSPNVEYKTGPFGSFIDLLGTLIGGGVQLGDLIPANLSPEVKQLMDALGSCEVELENWRKATQRRI